MNKFKVGDVITSINSPGRFKYLIKKVTNFYYFNKEIERYGNPYDGIEVNNSILLVDRLYILCNKKDKRKSPSWL